MYYYQLKCVLYTTDQVSITSDFFDYSFPTISSSLLDFFNDYQQKILTVSSSGSSSSSHRRSSQQQHYPTKHVPPTPISHTVPTTDPNVHNTYLKNHVDFRLGPIRLTSIDKLNCTAKQWQLGYGILHLYRTPKEETNDNDTTLCVLAVPSYMTETDFVQFVGTSHNVHVQHYRFVRDFAPNKYTVLMQFDSRTSADAFYTKFNGRRFNMTEPEISHVVYIQHQSIQTIVIDPHTYPHLFDTINQSVSFAELPTCPTCLERLDETVTGLKPIQCHHIATQCSCLNKWGQTSCPICQYSQKPSHKPKQTTLFDRQQCRCFQCGAADSLWICIICGHVGCGRYQSAHAYHHYCDSHHGYALEIDTQRVWDYVEDGYVHRLIQIEGGLVELPSSHKKILPQASSAVSSSSSGEEHEKMLDSMSIDHTYMMTSQLDSQRMYYEEQLEGLMKQLNILKEQSEAIKEAIQEGKAKHDLLIDRGVSLDMSVDDVQKDKEKVDKRVQSYKEKYRVMQKNLAEEKLLKQSLVKNNELLKKNVELKDEQWKAQSDQVKLLMALLEESNQ